MREFKAIRYERQDSVARILLDRPRVHNAQNETMLHELDEALAIAQGNEIRVVILAGIGRSFSSGHDLSLDPADGGALSRPAAAEERWEYEREIFYAQALRIWDFPKPTIAQVQGHCLAAGLVLASMCDLVVAGTDAKFGDPVMRMGAISTEILALPWSIGVRRAKRMLFTGDQIDAATAYAWGLATDLVEPEKLDAYTLELATRISQMPPFATRMLKRSINRVLDAAGFRLALDSHFDTHILGHQSVEARKYLEPADRGKISVSEFVKRRDQGFKAG